MSRVSDLIEEPRAPEDIKDDIEDAAQDVWKPSVVADATCNTVVMYQLLSKLRKMCTKVLQEMDEERARAYHPDEEFEVVAASAAGVDGFALTSSLVNAIHELAILSRDYEWWIDEHKEPIPEPLEQKGVIEP
jgi:hypothetical protein